MTRSRIEVHLPTDLSSGQLIAAMTTVLASLGHDLGTLYDEHMRLRAGPDWLEKLRKVRAALDRHDMYRRPLNLYDPSFCLNEPLRNPNSPLRDYLPRGRDFYDLMDDVARVRNEVQHFDGRIDARRLRARVTPVRELSRQANLLTASACDSLLRRLDDLVAAGGVLPDRRGAEIDDLQRQLRDAEEAASELSRRAADAAERLRAAEAADAAQADAAAAAGAENERLRLEVEQLRALQNLATEQGRTARRALHERRSADRSSDSSVDQGRPGDPWSGAPGRHVVKLLSHVGDLYDPASGTLLSDELGDVAVDAARRWLVHLPHGGTLHLDDGGRACALLGQSWTYLGDLDG